MLKEIWFMKCLLKTVLTGRGHLSQHSCALLNRPVLKRPYINYIFFQHGSFLMSLGKVSEGFMQKSKSKQCHESCNHNRLIKIA